MAEFMGLISGSYDAKEGGFLPGGGSLHSMMTPHGPDRVTFEKASKDELKPFKMRPDGLAFMFETCCSLYLTKWAIEPSQEGGKVLQKDYYACWQGMTKYFDPSNPNAGCA
jgi:homogentisate 1,2-dioxygenase